MRFFDFRFGRSAHHIPKHRHRFLNLEPLESRTVLAATGVLSGSTLNIMGGGGSFDQLHLNYDPTTNQLVLTEFNQVRGRFNDSAVQNITINGTALNNNI